ncbi:MAG: DUF4873 domain-containing protein [Mycobacterium kyogaense]|uniref:DUF4873 domain-containing protein n=1 Tax=Mycobacterium kyogaense TaxID=2212479 RepID=UPI002FF6314D
MTARTTTVVDVAVRGAGPGIEHFARRVRRAATTEPIVLPADLPMTFDAEEDRWILTGDNGSRYEARIVIDATEAADRRGLLDEGDARARFGPRRYLGVARHGLPNYFVAGDRDAARYIVRCLKAFGRRHATRIEIRGHAQSQAGRYIDLHLERLNPSVRKRPVLDDFEFTHRDDRESDGDYRGPAMITDANGTTYEVDIHVLAVFQPIDNAIRWSGRIQPTPLLNTLHRTVNQPITITVGANPAVSAVLVDRDPWGGSHILGSGASPYPLPLAAELAGTTDI